MQITWYQCPVLELAHMINLGKKVEIITLFINIWWDNQYFCWLSITRTRLGKTKKANSSWCVESCNSVSGSIGDETEMIENKGHLQTLCISIRLTMDLRWRLTAYGGGAVASWLVRSSSDRAVRVRALAGDTVLCSWARHLTLTVPLSPQEYKWLPENCWGNLTNCGEWPGLAPCLGGSKNTPSRLSATETGISPSSYEPVGTKVSHYLRWTSMPSRGD